MSPQFERVVIITIMTILVTLFSWIYMRDRQQRMGLWMLGWVWILIHFAALALVEFKLLPPQLARFVAIATLHLAGMSFLLSVSKACATWPRRRGYRVSRSTPAGRRFGACSWPQGRRSSWGHR